MEELSGAFDLNPSASALDPETVSETDVSLTQAQRACSARAQPVNTTVSSLLITPAFLLSLTTPVPYMDHDADECID